MSLPSTSYTPPGGGTIAGQQLAQGNAQLANAQPVGDPLVQAQGNATQQLADMQTPQNRAAYLNNSDLPAMQNNYDAVAKQLYQYDQMHLAPVYANQPGQTSDTASFGRVGPSSLFQLTPEAAGGPMTLFANDPSYAMTSQANQQNNILDVLNTLSGSISKEFQAKRGTYNSTVQSQKDILNSIKDLITTRNTVDYQNKSLQLQKDIANLQYGQNRQYHFNDTATQVRSEIEKGTYTNLKDAVDAMKAMFPEKTEQEIQEALGNPSQSQLDKIQSLTKSGKWELRPLPGPLNALLGKFYAYNVQTGETKSIKSPDDLNKLNSPTGNLNSRPPLSTFNHP